MKKCGRILVVDDDEAIRRLFARLLQNDYELAVAADGEEALETAMRFQPELVLLDLQLPGIDGYETCSRLKASPFGEHVFIIIVSARSSREEQLRAFACGADDYLVKPLDAQELRSRVRLHFRLRSALDKVTAIKTEIERQKSEARRAAEARERELLATQNVAILTLARIAESRDQCTGDHLVRMRTYCQILAEQLQEASPYADEIDRRFLDDLYRSSPLHDVGKVATSDAILLKPGRLTPDEFEKIKEHTTTGARILDEAVWQEHGGEFLAMAATIARYHHERFDGTGYPEGLGGTAIPLAARIVAVADVFDALTSSRPYKPAYSLLDSKEMIEIESGRHFDPVIVEAFEACFDELAEVHERYYGNTVLPRIARRDVRGAPPAGVVRGSFPVNDEGVSPTVALRPSLG